MNQPSESKSTTGRKASDRLKNFLVATGFALGVLGGGMLVQREDAPTTGATTAAPALIVTATATPAAVATATTSANAATVASDDTAAATTTEGEEAHTTVQSQSSSASPSRSFPGAMTSSRSSR